MDGQKKDAEAAVPALLRWLVLFTAGCVISVVIHMLHLERHVTEQPHSASIFAPQWVPLTCGSSAVAIGHLFPTLDRHFAVRPPINDWPNVLRCAIGFFGIGYASAKFSFENNAEMSCTLAACAVWLWWLTDRTLVGFSLSVAVATIGTVVVQLLVYFNVYVYTKPDFFYVRSWIPCLLFAAAMAFGNLGRQLA